MYIQYIIEYVNHYQNKVPGSLDVVLGPFLKDIGNNCRVLNQYIVLDEALNPVLPHVNIFGIPYENRIDVVIPTKHISEVKSLKTLRELEKNGVINLSIVESNFVKPDKGFAYAINQGARLNKNIGKYILILNDDVELDYYDIWRMKQMVADGIGCVAAGCSTTKWGYNGSMLMVPRRLFEDIGGFNEDYFFMWEDTDFISNIKKRGFKVVTADTHSIHEGGISIDTESKIWQENFELGRTIWGSRWENSNRIIGSMIVGNENGRYLSEVISDLFERDLIDRLVLVYDNSNEETVDEINELKNRYNIKTYYHDFKLFGWNESKLRQRAISYAINENPLGILVPDADEIFDKDLTREKIYELLKGGFGIDFKIAHYWGSRENIRVDSPYATQKNIRLFRYVPEAGYEFYDRNIHCGSAPIYTYTNRSDSGLILHHYGYVREKDLQKKIERENKYDKDMKENPRFIAGLVHEPVLQKFDEVTFLKTWKA